VIQHVLILWGVLGTAGLLAVLAHRRRPDDAVAPEHALVLGFVSAAYGLLLGLLVVTAVGHFNDVRTEAQKEASSLLALYDTVNVYTPATREPVQHELVCYMRSIIHDEWPSMARGTELEAPRTLRFGDRLRAQLRTLPTDGSGEASAYGRGAGLVTDAGQSRQRLLFLTTPQIPTILWVMIYVGAFLVFFLLAFHYAERPGGLVVVLGSVIVLMTVVVAVLSMLDQPFGFGVHVQPSQMHQAIQLLKRGGATNATILRPCS
jgi:hypothetical protein